MRISHSFDDYSTTTYSSNSLGDDFGSKTREYCIIMAFVHIGFSFDFLSSFFFFWHISRGRKKEAYCMYGLV